MDELAKVLIGSGPGGVVAAVVLYLYIRENNRNQQLVDKIIDLSSNTTGSLKDITNAVNAAIRVQTGGGK